MLKIPRVNEKLRMASLFCVQVSLIIKVDQQALYVNACKPFRPSQKEMRNKH